MKSIADAARMMTLSAAATEEPDAAAGDAGDDDDGWNDLVAERPVAGCVFAVRGYFRSTPFEGGGRLFSLN